MKRKSKLINLKSAIQYSTLFGTLIFSAYSQAKIADKRDEVKYRTSFGKCPSRAAGTLTLQLMKNFELNGSMKDLKVKILKEKLAEKHFISSYKIKYDPLKKFLQFNFDCPEPLMKVQIYKSNGLESYEAILVENGQLFDPTYEVLLRSEKKLSYDLPFLALPVGEMEEEVQEQITRLVRDMDLKFRKKLSEVIVNENKELTMILSIKGHPSSVFMGPEQWEDKVQKLRKIVSYMEGNKKIPAIINLTNPKKVVVKFK
ncbi:cell division protein FtsQ/DivIB [Halobacteriovorax sp. GB3]|uniref:cell division protein FtsQ/DivIB n=1 Tax=Halobacteriovorax sp. GB3 TaxID=2719615 RepID=UPI00235F0FDE|nr:cell division protein FtsQ/DivIB [Halobacteriovorax sp. GB3]MDD0854657.1 cell division protein FtsQ/DivIB [Halobacteriovorax sp. GB3]